LVFLAVAVVRNAFDIFIVRIYPAIAAIGYRRSANRGLWRIDRAGFLPLAVGTKRKRKKKQE